MTQPIGRHTHSAHAEVVIACTQAHTQLISVCRQERKNVGKMKHPLEPAVFCSLMRIESDVNVLMKVHAPIYVYAYGIRQLKCFDCRYSACVSAGGMC